jgi:hypothetical protein
MDAESLAAYLSVCRTQPDVRAAILDLKSVWVKEAPDAMGGDLLGICMTAPVDVAIPVEIIRVQVKVATQECLASPCSRAASDRTYEALQGLLNPSLAATKQTEESAKVRHQPTLKAVEGFMRGLLLCKDESGPEPSTWHERYTATAAAFEFKHQRPYITTTHIVPACVKSNCLKAGATVLDAEELDGDWGPLGDACKALGILPFAKKACGAAASVGGGSDALQRALNRAMVPSEKHP